VIIFLLVYIKHFIFMDHFTDYINTIARMSILKAKAAYTCPAHPDVLIRAENSAAEERACYVAQNTLKYNDKAFLIENMTTTVRRELDSADVRCRQCGDNIPRQ
jgi:hypothetical protein